MGAWTTGPRTATWVETPVIGDGTTSNGGTPPWIANEFAPIDEIGYTRADWLGAEAARVPIAGDPAVVGGGKFRITLQPLRFGQFDPIIMRGMRGMAHLHEFKGNIAADENATWQSMRRRPGSNNIGGPLNGSLYWAPAMLFLDPNTGLYLPIKSLYSALYYNLESEADPAKTFRLPRGIEIIGGVDPADRFNTARLAELPSFMVKETWSGTPGASTMSGSNRYNGWMGWSLFKPGFGSLPVDPGSTADINPQTGFPRQLVNADGSNPWSGDPRNADADCILVAMTMQPTYWNGWDNTSPNGRDHLRYWGNRSGYGSPMERIGPTGWWQFLNVENKDFFPNGRNGISGHAWRERLWFSSDLYNMAGGLWSTPHPNGSTPHFDLIPCWDDEVLTGATGWQRQCPGINTGGAGSPADCNSGTINATQNLKGGARPVGYGDDMSPDPILSISETAPAATKDGCGIPVLNDRIPIAVSTC